MYPALEVVVWACVAFFVLTGIITLLAIIQLIKMQEFFLRKLFFAFLLEIVGVSIAGYATALKSGVQQDVSGLNETVQTTLQSLEDRVRLLEKVASQK